MLSTVRGMADNLEASEKFLDGMQEIMKAGGLECDDSTVIQKLEKINVSTILSGGVDLASTIDSIYTLASSAVQAVH